MDAFDRTLRPLLYDPQRIVGPFVGPGDRVMDLGCGAGYFSPTLSRLAGPAGEVFVVDIQEEMVARAVERVREDAEAGARATGVIVDPKDPQLPPDIDFALMSWMLHEVEEPETYWRALRHSIRPAGKVLITEPLIHVSAERWESELAPAERMGFSRRDAGGVFFSRTAVLTRR
jgi:ubiquinone/menaquinone biosynthesis C-methylase UbiE